MREVVRKLSEQEFALMKPELTAYIEGQKAQDRLNRMLGLFAPGCDLDLQMLTLVREVAEPEPVCEDGCDDEPPAEEVHAASE